MSSAGTTPAGVTFAGVTVPGWQHVTAVRVRALRRVIGLHVQHPAGHDHATTAPGDRADLAGRPLTPVKSRIVS
ncbi:hypothetical protein ACFYOT_34375 [Saccharothrix saharensis]|uniref:hypothetical protein n=1 Tax=Saccharothrix saharensis TaxID=571190 RepID=UPI0036957079